MALAEDSKEGWVPTDTFGARLALVRQHLGGWNVTRAADLCGISDQNWARWEKGGDCRGYTRICRKIADATGCNLDWLMKGGPILPSTFSWNVQTAAGKQDELPFQSQERAVIDLRDSSHLALV